MNAESMPAVIMAGGRAKPDLEAATGQSSRALVPVNGKTLLAHVLDALRASGRCGRIAIVGDLPEQPDTVRVPDSGSFTGNLFAGVEACGGAPHVLIATADLPFISGESVADFVDAAIARCQTDTAAFVYPVVPVERCYARYPGVKRTALRLRDGVFTGGNLMLLRPEVLIAQRQRISDAYAARKSPLRLAGMLGAETLARLVISQKLSPGALSIEFLERQVTRVLGGRAAAIISQYPEIATDLDRPSDFQAVGLTIGSAAEQEKGPK